MATSRNPMDSMKSTWRTWDQDQWKLPHKTFERVNVYHIDLNRKVPIHPKEDKIPYVSDWSLNRWVLITSGVPLLVHQFFTYFTGYNFHPIIAFFYYYQASRLLTTRELRTLRELGHTYGFLDGDKHERDGVPDVGVSKALISVMLAGFVRPLMTVWLTYDANKAPASLSWPWLLVEISLYGIILDFWFYWYHRVMHDVNGLWKFHRTHHLTKHPNPLLTIYADSEQEFFDIAGIPLMTWFTMKLMASGWTIFPDPRPPDALSGAVVSSSPRDLPQLAEISFMLQSPSGGCLSWKLTRRIRDPQAPTATILSRHPD
ncbi:unnamed protein product [Penicillium palitans]